jgi:hypothetical protein
LKKQRKIIDKWKSPNIEKRHRAPNNANSADAKSRAADYQRYATPHEYRVFSHAA